MIKSVRIPQERVAVLIGRGGGAKRYVESMTRTKLTVDEDVTISGDAIDVMTAENVVRAIGRGFSPHNATELCEESNTMEIIELPKDERQRKRIASRIIGAHGKSRKNMEMLTRTRISVYGKTVAIIGSYERAERARRAAEMLIKGYSHKAVYKFLGHA